jgi:hypothetical protein
MGQLPYAVGDRVLASRSEDGQDHEEATVVDAYELLINLAPRPMVVVDFPDGERRWLTATEPFVRPLQVEAESAALGEADVGDAAELGADDPLVLAADADAADADAADDEAAR